jgi:hypothetical protein
MDVRDVGMCMGDGSKCRSGWMLMNVDVGRREETAVTRFKYRLVGNSESK